MRILYADDDPDEQTIFSEALKSIDKTIECTTASDGFEALAILSRSHHYDCIFLDLAMPGMSGKECLKTIRQRPELDKIPVIIYSSQIGEGENEYLKKSGARMVLSKQWTITQLCNELKNALATLAQSQNN